MILSDIIGVLNRIAPLELSEDWDNSGLQVGNLSWNIKKILISLDASPEVIKYAISNEFDLLISHHPMIFKSLKSIDFDKGTGSLIYEAALSKLSVFSAHTNLDSAEGGLNDILCKIIDLKDLTVLANSIESEGENLTGLGRVGNLEKSMKLSDFADYIMEKLDIKNLRFSGNGEDIINKVAVCTGSGSSLIGSFLKSGAQTYLTGDIKYHEAQNIIENGKSVIDIGHFASEHIITDSLKEILEKELPDDIEIVPCKIEKDPFTTVFK